MTINRAAILNPKQIDQAVLLIRETSENPERDELMFLLSHLAGLRVSEIVKLNIDTAFLDAEGRIPARQSERFITILSNVGKKEKMRTIPMHPRIADAVKVFIKKFPNLNYVAYAPRRKMARASVDNITVWFWSFYKRAGFTNCSSHTGRRTFATRTGRMLNQHGQSIKDLQMLLGHTRLETTEAYLEPTNHTHNMITSL